MKKMDGSGYPDCLKGHDLKDFVKAFTIVDIFEALVNERPYKKKMSLEEAMQVIEEMKGSKLDEELVDEFKEYVEEKIEYMARVAQFDTITDRYDSGIGQFLDKQRNTDF